MTEHEDKHWNVQYEKLVEFKRKNGHSIVPVNYKQDKDLGQWARAQRQKHAKHGMLPDRKDLLDELGFVWRSVDGSYLESRWNQHCQKLIEFKETNGHCMVPARYEQEPSLGRWVARQRCFHNNNTIRPDRKELLDQIGFAWKGEDARWTNNVDKIWFQQYEKMIEFKRTNGHCTVPHWYEYKKDKSLGQWVKDQRAKYAKNKMQPARKELLDDIGFFWTALEASRSSTKDVRGLVIEPFRAWDRPCF
jgi:hypothetical protein